MEADGFVLNTRRKGQKGFRKAQKEHVPEDRSHVTEKDVEEAITSVQSRVSDFASQIAYLISSHLPTNAKVVQLQMYGMGPIDSRFTSGSYQMAVAFDLLTHFRKIYPPCTATFQELVIAPGEAEYLTKHGIKVLNSVSFDGKHLHEAESTFTADASQQPALVCYMIHGHWSMLDAFLAAHWTASQLSRIVIVGNSLQDVASAALLTEIPPRVLAFAKVCKEHSIEQFAGGQVGLHFTQTAVISISFDNACVLIESECVN
uniref:SRR1 domain-containing protein n=1 Tax=Panagrellus redivivus TaxID=6233 RepID=A0A7E4W4Z5_PANRE